MTKPPFTSRSVSVTRRRLLQGGGAAGAAAVAGLASPAAFGQAAPAVARPTGGRVIVRTPGGVYEDAWRKACWEPFTAETGIEVVPVATNAAKIMAMVETGASDVDVLDFGEIQFPTLAERGALVRLDRAKFTRTDLADVDPVGDYYVGAIVYSTTLSYNSQTLGGRAPAGWRDFWDVKSFPGKRTLCDIASGVLDLEFALIADGVPMKELYPLDVDRAFKKLGEIRPHIVKWWDTGAVASQLLAEKQAVMGSLWNGRAQTLREQGFPIVVQWNEAQRMTQGFAIMKTSPNVENAYKLIDYSLQPKVQAALVQRVAYGPVNRRAFDFIPAELAAQMPTSPANLKVSFANDPLWWTKNGKMVAERWQEFLLER